MKDVLDLICKQLTDKESEKLLKKLSKDCKEPRNNLLKCLEDASWCEIKNQLERMRKHNIADDIKRNTLITEGAFLFPIHAVLIPQFLPIQIMI